MTVFSSTGKLREDLVVEELHNVCNRPYARLSDANNILTLTECLNRNWVMKIPKFGTFVYKPTRKGRLIARVAIPLFKKG